MKTKDALKILHKDMEKSPRLKKMVEKERANLQAAIAIREAREKAGLTQAGLAKLIQTTQSVIARLENADYEGHTLKILARIASALNRHVEVRFTPPQHPGHHSHAQYPAA